MTRDQVNIAAGVRDELLLMFEDARSLIERELALDGICEHYGLPALDGALRAKLAQAVLACDAAHAAYEEFSSALSVQTGDPAAGSSSPAAGEPLKAAA